MPIIPFRNIMKNVRLLRFGIIREFVVTTIYYPPFLDKGRGSLT